ncbi:MAG: pyruvate dehydrogenase (acetyl-transferring), homodimeric type [Planctomycetota bacterium]|nr:pyruvate dehydrogenase (acetyl-transferring), homodimeric type [Planctomycetota bacterium]
MSILPDRQLMHDVDPAETREWLESLEDVLSRHGPERVRYLLRLLEAKAQREGVSLPFTANTQYVNTISVEDQPRYPGNREIERRIKSIVRWNAMAMVVRANRDTPGIGGHISTYASAATLFEVGFNHFFRARGPYFSGDQVYYQGHASPGVYARAFLEGRLSKEHLENFRRELRPGGGLSSYPHPWLMPHFWEFPTVSMGLSPIMAIYQARFNRYLHDRGVKDTSGSHVWCFIGDGETDEPETLGAITLASREQLDNLIFVINCNLQRLDGPVRGNGKIIQELEAIFRGAGWNVIKVIWGSDWDPLLARDDDGELVARMGEVVDGQYQKYSVEPGSYTREHFFGTSPKLREMVESLTDDQIRKLRRGGHDPVKVYAAYKAAVEHRGSPTVILAKTIKGYGIGEAGEGRNITHQQKKLNEDELREFRTRFGIPISDEEIAEAPFYVPPENSVEMRYLREGRGALGGYVPSGSLQSAAPLEVPPLENFKESLQASGDREVSTTMAFVRFFSRLLRDPQIGKLIVPIIADEARTFGMEGLFRQIGIYSHIGQKYEPVDRETVLYYREAKDAQLHEEGITEAVSMATYIAAGTAWTQHGVNMIPFFIYYSMFGMQRVGDLVWAAADSRCKGFLLGGTAGRTTLAGEGLQHQDGHSPLLAGAVPNLMVYDPAWAYETVVIILDGIRRMYQEKEPLFYYITLYNENYKMPDLPQREGVVEGILRGMYLFRSRESGQNGAKVQLLASGPILREALRAQDILAEKYDVGSDVWSVTSWKELRRDADSAERWNTLHPAAEPRSYFLREKLAGREGPVVAASDYIGTLPGQIARWLPGSMTVCGTDGFGRSDTRAALRRHFENDAESITVAALGALAREGKFDRKTIERAVRDLEIDPEKPEPAKQ